MKVVAVSQRVDHYPDRHETRDALDRNMVIWLRAAGYLPYPVPNALFSESEITVWLDRLQPCSLVLSGGNDVGGNRGRDFTEEMMMTYAERRNLPLLGICRGMQMMAHWAGGSLHPVQSHIKTRHRLVGEMAGDVNSYHGFSLATCPEEFDVLARSEDGEIEAIRHQSLPWEGWMWHPEREAEFASKDIQRLKALFL